MAPIEFRVISLATASQRRASGRPCALASATARHHVSWRRADYPTVGAAEWITGVSPPPRAQPEISSFRAGASMSL